MRVIIPNKVARFLWPMVYANELLTVSWLHFWVPGSKMEVLVSSVLSLGL